MIDQDLPPDDLPPRQITDRDIALQKQLEDSIRQCFFSHCEGSTQVLLAECQWTIRILEPVTLIIYCSSQAKNWQILNHMVDFANQLNQFSPSARIKVYPPAGKGAPFDMRIDERSAYQSS
ncbi:hypothetical protein [Acaryochloris sp. IP29b_bin.137]|uniref:hypothetical protein n=1 Tax=Acaryochloris sp. IP29b_bin.137 TaxID=2969217 RepID=UPI00262A1D63|nr:hypothetical protein [Acaryochloris sp. IP29b_bin.137]